ncbi:hypothetical protein A7X67_10545 [Clostridium sp. W14A]|nr:hypothetical protein A7X67_10545 [Clostridium sp. W14A]
MFGVGWLNIASLVFGLIAWILPVVNLTQRNKANSRSWPVFSVASAASCAVSLYMQILYTDHLVQVEDWSALLDTSHAVAWLSAVLLIVTIVLNVVTLAVCRRKRKTGIG